MMVALLGGALVGWLLLGALGEPFVAQLVAAVTCAISAWTLRVAFVDFDDIEEPAEEQRGASSYELPDRLVYRLSRSVPDASVVEAIEVLLHRDDMRKLPTTTEREA